MPCEQLMFTLGPSALTKLARRTLIWSASQTHAEAQADRRVFAQVEPVVHNAWVALEKLERAVAHLGTKLFRVRTETGACRFASPADTICVSYT